MKFTHPSNFFQHVKLVHKGIKEYQCTACGNHYSTNQKLKSHIKAIHEKDKSNTQEDVQDHGDQIENQVEVKGKVKDQSDFSGREHTCQICGKKFKGIELTRHFMVQCAPSESQKSNWTKVTC